MSAVEKLLGETARADAQRNVRRLVAAAREAVAEVGVEVTAHEIARRAGVGIGTFYRRLPSREALLQAVVEDTVYEIVELARDALRDPDPWHGFCTFAADFVQLRAMSCGINEALGTDCALPLDTPLEQLREQIRLLVERCQESGAMRDDVAWQDVPFVLTSVMTGDRTIGLTAADDQWRRNLRVVLAGLRAQQVHTSE
ncbi:TetR/AcrR family transcriptional regulator [Saccharopolyspora indica]|uniref:TetR/AcrR family transcriptional regulator n=1 Tax=Saccharopolyspora indica TaxID=1229659 RepID=UPI0022EB85AD|nr:TetR/AcrR family transcriptional regulator [Saccharopolyspora indica]MDA3646696.1 TetR/AcrR family transcriptional regulator [Saccharopolyspora indica]